MWACLGTAAWLAVAAAGPRRLRATAPAGLAWWGACVLMLDWHLGMVETPDGRPRRLGPADALTLARAWLVPIVWHRPDALSCIVAGVSDAIDGPLARRRAPTRAGRDFDSIVDACFATAALRGATRHRLLERWAVRTQAAWLVVGVAHAAHAYFLEIDQPDPSLTRAARVFAPLRTAGLILGAAGRRRGGSALLGGHALASVALTGYQHARGAGRGLRTPATPVGPRRLCRRGSVADADMPAVEAVAV